MKLMPIAKFDEIKQILAIQDDDFFLYHLEEDGSLKLIKISEYEVFVEEGLKEVYDNEPVGLWEKCLEN
jgi:hypothetical protein